MSGAGDDLDAELAQLLEGAGRQEQVAVALQRFAERLHEVLVAEIRVLVAELSAAGGVSFEDAAAPVAGLLRTIADEVERG